jgi:general secretion pathway protein A
MYCDFYQLTERPFNVTPDPKFLYLNARYREALASLNYGITQRKGFITLIGEAGTGKTTLLNKLLEDLDPKTKSVFIFNTNVTFEEILEYIFAEFDLPVHNGKKLYMLQRLNAFLLDELRAGVNVALLIDEAQDLQFSVLEDLRLLSNLETAKEKILQIVLSGQPELGQKLSNPILRQLRQRIGINSRLLPLSRDEITEYLQYRLQAAGCPDLKLFSREAEEQIYHFSRGIPRLVNVACDNALVIGYALGKKRIGAEIITEAAADLLSNEPVAEEQRPVHIPSAPSVSPVASAASQSRWRPRLAVISVLIVAVAVGLLSVGRSILLRPAEENVSTELVRPRLEVIRPGSQPEGTGVEAPAARPAESFGNTAPVSDDRANRVSPPPPAKAIAARGPVTAGDVGTPDDRASEGRSAPIVPPVPGSDAAQKRDGEASVHGARASQEVVLGGPHVEHPNVASERPVSAPEAVPVALNPPKDEQAHSTGKLSEPLPKGEATALNRKQRESVPMEMKEAEREDPAGLGGVVDVGRQPRLEGMPLTHVVVSSGDSVSGIARRKYGQASYTVLDLLKLANPELRDINVITVGQTIHLPELGDGFPIFRDGSGHYALLVLSTPHAFRAAAVQNALRSRGVEAHVSGGSLGFEKPVFRVVLSGYTDREEIAGVGRQVQKLFRDDTRIAQLGD